VEDIDARAVRFKPVREIGDHVEVADLGDRWEGDEIAQECYGIGELRAHIDVLGQWGGLKTV